MQSFPDTGFFNSDEIKWKIWPCIRK
jgi:hypothetical protein